MEMIPIQEHRTSLGRADETLVISSVGGFVDVCMYTLTEKLMQVKKKPALIGKCSNTSQKKGLKILFQ